MYIFGTLSYGAHTKIYKQFIYKSDNVKSVISSMDLFVMRCLRNFIKLQNAVYIIYTINLNINKACKFWKLYNNVHLIRM